MFVSSESVDALKFTSCIMTVGYMFISQPETIGVKTIMLYCPSYLVLLLPNLYL